MALTADQAHELAIRELGRCAGGPTPPQNNRPATAEEKRARMLTRLDAGSDRRKAGIAVCALRSRPFDTSPHSTISANKSILLLPHRFQTKAGTTSSAAARTVNYLI